MSRRRRSRRGVSLGTVVMLLLTIVVLGGFCALLPRLTGVTDVRTNAAELAVAIDQSLSQIAASGVSLVGPTPQASPIQSGHRHAHGRGADHAAGAALYAVRGREHPDQFQRAKGPHG